MGKIPFNRLSPAEAERLAMLAEECGEIVQVVGKILRHGYQSHHPDDPETTNLSLLRKELGDLFAVLDLMEDEGLSEARFEAVCALREQKLRYAHHQEDDDG